MSKISNVDGLFLTKVPIKNDIVEKNVKTSLHQILIADRSYSMYGVLSNLISDLKRQLRLLQPGDYVSFGWFSSEGQFSFPIKSFPITGNESFEQLDKLFDKYKQPVGMTCFSEILEDLKKLLTEVDWLESKTSVMFFTDGWANDPSVSKEHSSVRKVMEELAPSIDSLLTVAYSDYADKDFLTEMAQIGGGESIQANHIHQFSTFLNKFIRGSVSSEPKQSVVLTNIEPSSIRGIFTLQETGDDGSVILHKLNDDGSIYVQGKTDNLYIITDSEIQNMKVGMSEFSTAEIDEGEIYASALVLSLNGGQDEAIGVIGALGDVGILNSLSNAYTPTEKGQAETFLRDAVFDTRLRYIFGKDTNALPKDDAFCVLDVFDVLTKDRDARIHVKHSAFEYKRIGPPSITLEGYPKFISETGASSPISDVVWHEELLNLSLRVRIPGNVYLPEEFKIPQRIPDDHTGQTIIDENSEVVMRPESLPEEFETNLWRTYNIVKDGFLHTSKLPISCSEETYKVLRDNFVIEGPNELDGWINEKQIHILNLSSIPIINRKIAKAPVQASQFAANAFNERVLEGRIKVLKALRNELDPNKDRSAKRVPWSDEEKKYLLAAGFREDGSFSPPSTKAESVDKVDVTFFKTSFKGFSTFPSMKDLRERMDKIKKWDGKGKQPLYTQSMIPMAYMLKQFEETTLGWALFKQIQWIDDEMTFINNRLKELRSDQQRTKFAMFLGHRWFGDVPGDSSSVKKIEMDMEIDRNLPFKPELDSVKVTIEVDKMQVPI